MNFERKEKAMNTKPKRALEIAIDAHIEDSWGNQPYLTHLALTAYNTTLILAEAEIEDTDDFVNAAWLHDVIEDHPEYEDQIREEFPELINSLLLVTRGKKGTYADFIDKIVGSGDKIAVVVKLADMTTNLSNNPPSNLRKRYEKNIEKLREAVQNLDW